ncbi:Choline transport protein [Spathaspora sp. JA1]|nr:Choline transport protein [Spathaspora sp. JA1]
MKNSSEKNLEKTEIYQVSSISNDDALVYAAYGKAGGNLDELALADSKKAAHLLEEARANLELAEEGGYTPELRRNFSLLSLLGVGFGLTNSWYGISASLVAGINSGGPMLIIYGIIILASIGMCVAVSLGEMASAMPNSGGQYYWTQKLAPKKYAAVSSYLCGSLAWAGAVFTSAAVTVTIGSSVVGMYMISHPEKEVQKWQVFLVYEVANLMLVIFNVYEGPLPHISKASLYITLSSFCIITIVVLSMSGGEFSSPKFVFTEFTNGTGWSSSAIAFFVGLINPNWSFSCLDAATHIAEESSRPRTDVPKAIIGTVIIGFITSFSYSIAMFFCIKDLDAINNSNTGVPIMDIYYQATNSKAAAIGLQFLILFTAFACNINCQTWQARLAWSFSRDNGLPGSKIWAKVNQKTGSVVNSHLMSCGWNAVIGFIYLGSTTAFNSILTCCVLFLSISYSIPTFFLIFKRNQIKPGPFWLSRFNIGLCCNIIVVCWSVFTFIFYNFPPVMPVTLGNMNYSCVVFGIYFLYCFIDWQLRAKHCFITAEEREARKDELTRQLSQQVSKIEVVVSNIEKTV